VFIRCYLRASTREQDASRAKESLESFVNEKGAAIASWYVENASGATPDRTELRRLLSDSRDGDILLVESIDRLSRLPKAEWERLRAEIESKGIRVVALDLPTSHSALSETGADEFTSRMLDSINRMLSDMLAALSRVDYEVRRKRQAQGIAKAKEAGVYRGRPKSHDLHRKVQELLGAGLSIRATARHAGCANSTVQRIKAELNRGN